MAEIIPFKGILYNPEVINGTAMAKAMAPPYDVISSRMQDKLHRSHRYNIVRLILGKARPSDTKSNNRYTRARDFLNEWLRTGVLKRDDERALYIYEQRYLYKGEEKTRIGFIGLMKLEDPAKSEVLPHEYTFAGPKKDRLKLLSEVKANLSPIFSLFEDENLYVTNILKKVMRKDPPLIDIKIDGVDHRLWRIKSSDLINRIRGFMKSRTIFIADGHHRYEVALAFSNQMKKKGIFNTAFNYTMVYFSNINPEAVTILSTHRAVKDICSLTKDLLLSKLKEFFEIKEFKSKKEMFLNLKKPDCIRFGLYCGKNNFYVLILKDEDVLDRLICAEKSSHWKRLGVNVLHQLIFNRILKIKEKIAKEENVLYTIDENDAIKLVDEKRCKAVFFLNPTGIDQLKNIARSRDRMPHKSTYFYPKLLSGLVINKF